MADNKQYITQSCDTGRILISEDVIASITLHALSEVDGFAGLTSKHSNDIVELLNAKNWGKGIRVYISEKNDVSVECNVLVQYGCVIRTVAEAIQEAVLTAVNSVTGIQLLSVNVNICGIVRK